MNVAVYRGISLAYWITKLMCGRRTMDQNTGKATVALWRSCAEESLFTMEPFQEIYRRVAFHNFLPPLQALNSLRKVPKGSLDFKKIDHISLDNKTRVRLQIIRLSNSAHRPRTYKLPALTYWSLHILWWLHERFFCERCCYCCRWINNVLEEYL